MYVYVVEPDFLCYWLDFKGTAVNIYFQRFKKNMYRLNMQRCICCDYFFLLSLSLYMILPLLLNNNTILQSLVGAIVRYLLGNRKVDIFDASKATNSRWTNCYSYRYDTFEGCSPTPKLLYLCANKRPPNKIL